MNNFWVKWINTGYVLLFGLFGLYSFSQLDLNLTLYNYPLLLKIVNQIQYWGYYQRSLSTSILGILSVFLLLGYGYLIHTGHQLAIKQMVFTIIGILLCGIVAYPLFSHDIFNYLFNAKMILMYHANPHVHTALEFPHDLWTRFMHNTHTVAPYGYGWTGLSLIPVFFTIHNFTLSLWAMKVWVSLFFILECYLIYRIAGIRNQSNPYQRAFVILLNPLLLIETVYIGHNDSVMLALLLVSLYLWERNSNPLTIFGGWISFIASVFIKYATVVLIPLILLRKKLDLYTWGGILLLLLPLTRPEQVHSWYLHWGMALLVLSPKPWAIPLVYILTFGGLLRYIPFVLFGSWDPPVPFWRWLILIVPLAFLLSKKFRHYINLS